MIIIVSILVVIVAFAAIGYWWRFRSLACPANLSWFVENPYVNAIAGPATIFNRIKLAEGMKLLDVGPGPGRLTIPAAQIVGDTGEVVALDIQQKMLDKLQTKLQSAGIANVRLIHAGAGEGKADKNYFDRVLLVTVLGEIRDKKNALVEIYQALKGGGVLSITELIPDPHYTKRKTIRTLCHAAGFEEADLFGNWFSFTINFVKPVSD